MRSTQLIAGISAIVLIVILFNLPKVVINKSDKGKLSQKSSSETATVLPKSIPKAAIPQKQIEKITLLRNKFSTAPTNQKKRIFADSLLKSFVFIEKFDSALKYGREIVLFDRSVSTAKEVGDVYYSVFERTTEIEILQVFASEIQNLYGLVLEKDTAQLEVRTKLAMTYTISNNPMKAISELKKVVAINPAYRSAILNLGLLSIQSSQFAKAQERFERLLTLDSKDWEALLYLGVVYKELKKNSEAEEAFKKVINNSKDQALVSEARSNLSN